MIASNVCRAKDPATCWKHGDAVTLSRKIVLEPKLVHKKLSEIQAEIEEAYKIGDSDAFLEAKTNEKAILLTYDATLEGLGKLQKEDSRIGAAPSREKSVSPRLQKAFEHRKELLANDEVELNRANHIAHLKALPDAELTIEVSQITEEKRAEWNKLPSGTPFLIETTVGYHIGLSVTENEPYIGKNWFKKKMNEVEFISKTPFGYRVALQDAQVRVNLKDTDKITRLPKDFKFTSGEKYLPSVSPIASLDDAKAYGRYAVIGENSYREFEGTFRVDRSNKAKSYLVGSPGDNDHNSEIFIPLSSVKSIKKI